MQHPAAEVRPIGHPLADVQSAQILKINEVCALTGLSRASVYRLAACREFVAPIKIGIRASGWRLSEIQDWLAKRQTGIRLAA